MENEQTNKNLVFVFIGQHGKHYGACVKKNLSVTKDRKKLRPYKFKKYMKIKIGPNLIISYSYKLLINVQWTFLKAIAA